MAFLSTVWPRSFGSSLLNAASMNDENCFISQYFDHLTAISVASRMGHILDKSIFSKSPSIPSSQVLG